MDGRSRFGPAGFKSRLRRRGPWRARARADDETEATCHATNLASIEEHEGLAAPPTSPAYAAGRRCDRAPSAPLDERRLPKICNALRYKYPEGLNS